MHKRENMNKNYKKEISIFKKFVRLCPYSINFSSITKRQPPEPDIFCSLTDGSTISFELVEIIDKDLQKSRGDRDTIKKAFNNKLEEFPRKKKEQFKEKYRDAEIYVYFIKDSLLHKKKDLIQKIINYLVKLENNTESEIPFNNLCKISINRGGFRGPCFEVSAAAWIHDPLIECIKIKLRKRYKIKSNRAELLAYYDFQPEEADDIADYNLKELRNFIKSNIESSVFQRVWIYSVRRNKIIFIYPNYLDPKQINIKRE